MHDAVKVKKAKTSRTQCDSRCAKCVYQLILAQLHVLQHITEVLPVAARGCLPPGTNVCVAAPTNQISSAIKVFVRISDTGA